MELSEKSIILIIIDTVIITITIIDIIIIMIIAIFIIIILFSSKYIVVYRSRVIQSFSELGLDAMSAVEWV